jgi:hypothetical protein
MMTDLTTLNASEVAAVSGGGGAPAIGPVKPQEVLAQDMYGNTMSVEAWMDYQANVLPNYPNPHDGYDPHDFPGGRGQ